MPLRENPVKAAIKAGKLSVGTMVFETFSHGLPRVLATTGAEFAIYDMEHSGASLETIRAMMAASRGPSPVPMVRVPATEYHFMAGALDAGALGLMIPMVESRQQAERIAEATKYPPVGRRGAAFGFAHDDYERGDVAAKVLALNERTMILAQIESERGLANVDEIAAVDGIDVLWVGHFDLTNFLGIPAQFDNPIFLRAIDRVIEVANKHGKTAGINADDVATCAKWIDRGFRMIAYSSDLRLIANGLSDGVARTRAHRATVVGVPVSNSVARPPISVSQSRTPQDSTGPQSAMAFRGRAVDPPSSKISQILDVLGLVRQAKPDSLLTVKSSRVKATDHVATRLNIRVQTVLDKYDRQLGLEAGQFDQLVLDWIAESDTGLRDALDAGVASTRRDADLAAIAHFFSRSAG